MNSTYKRAQSMLQIICASALAGSAPDAAAQAREASEHPQGLWRTAAKAASATLLTTEWSVDRSKQSAIVRANNSSSGIFAGVQCDQFDPRGRRLILGAVRSVDRDGLIGEMIRPESSKLVVTIETDSAYSRFSSFTEDRGVLDLGMKSNYAASYLSAEQYDLMKKARSFTVSFGKRTYYFSGSGSSRSIGALSCDNRRMTVASRSIMARHSEPARPVQTPWQFASHSGAASLIKGNFEASTTVANFPNSELASFQLRISCHGGRLFARFAGGSVANSVIDPRASSAKAFVNAVDSSQNVATVYRSGSRIAKIPVDGAASPQKGYELSYDDISALFEFDQIVVSGGDSTIEFGNKNAGPAILAVSQACGAKD